MSTVLITGANRGLGIEFAAQFAAEGWDTIACCRNPETAAELNQLDKKFPNLSIEALDVMSFDQIDALSARLQHRPIDVLINNAGVYGDKSGHGFGDLDYQMWQQTLLINTLAPVKMAEAFVSQLELGDKKLLVSITSQMGSIADNTSGGSILYRSSKAALNAAMKSVSLDLKARGFGVLVLHPGWVRTDMGGPQGLIDAKQSVTGMRNIIENFSADQSGQFIKYDGSLLPW
ncbi:MAG: SDR family oxidoreductase [Methylicorpusculum sp.]|uniref:SDR family oxidoreductase n=1 Tax=Methylicorpusculum sp. TaxID=2713644 RepID=UPI002717F191|nr:SDR family oxidoreductase [Methylicorpusculum sp.]MDO8940543.1 SDR family oxidoreductase [Methylicorpusculum sp.]MDP2204451.1 SDR family oxidoreductase [Methylicorpusculum sp.]